MPRRWIPALVFCLLAASVALSGLRPSTYAQRAPAGPAADLVLFSSDRGGVFQLYTMKLDGSGVKQVVTTPGKAFENALACNGRIVTVVEPPGTQWHSLWTVNLDGTALQEITPGQTGEHMPAWRPDGFQIVFSSHRNSSRDIYLINADGTGQQRISRDNEDEIWPHWSPDTGLFALQYGEPPSRTDLYTLTPDGATYRQLTRTGDAGEPRWGPGGGNLVFTRQAGRDSDIWVADVTRPDATTGVVMRPLVTGSTYDHQPSFLPDGSRILFVRGRESDADAEIWSVKLDGTDPKNLTGAPGSREMWPATGCLSPLVPTPTPPPTPLPAPTPAAASCVCDIVLKRVPQVVINDALANPGRFYGWRYPLDLGKPPSPANPPRECLTLQNVNLDYHPLWNKPQWRVGCP